MKGRNVLAFVVSFLLAAAVLAQGSGEAKAKKAPKAAASKAVIWPAADLKWADMTPGPPGVKGMRVVIVSGTFIHGPEGKPEVKLGSGSYLYQPGGSYRHTTACDNASECIVFAESAGKFDIKMVDEGKAPAKK